MVKIQNPLDGKKYSVSPLHGNPVGNLSIRWIHKTGSPRFGSSYRKETAKMTGGSADVSNLIPQKKTGNYPWIKYIFLSM